MSIQSVIFDWGGVLMRTRSRTSRHAWDARLDLPSGTVESVVHGIDAWRRVQLGEITLEAYWKAVRKKLQLPEHEVAALRHDFYRQDQLDMSLVSYIRQLRERGLLIGLLSNNTIDLEDTMIELGLDGLFDAVVISAEIGVIKPDPAAYHAVLEELAVQPSGAVFVDDFIHNVEGARAVGLQAIHFTPGLDLPARIEPLIERNAS